MTTTTSPTADAISRALDELNGQVPDDCESETREQAIAGMTEIHDKLGLDFEAVVDAAHAAGRTAMTVYSPRDFLLEPMESMAGLWQAGFLVGARAQQLLAEASTEDATTD